jgi:hypothetical protein
MKCARQNATAEKEVNRENSLLNTSAYVGGCPAATEVLGEDTCPSNKTFNFDALLSG